MRDDVLRRVLSLGALWLACVAMAAAETLTLGTYNLGNYTLANRRLADGGFRPDYPKPEAEKAALREVIRAMDADVIALQEVGGEGFLAELRRDLAREGADYPHGAAPAGGDEARGLAVLSRLPLGKVVLHRDLVARRDGAQAEEAVRRGLLEVEIPTASGPVTLWVVHLKSRLTEDAADPAAAEQRVAEARAVRDRVLERFPDPGAARFVIAGDFNDTPGSRALRAVQARGKTPIATWLDAEDERGQRWTHVYARIATYSRFDHVLVSEGLRRGDEARASARIVGEPWRAVHAASDHRPIVATLRVSEP
jgi:endonuclease/exonuclease/phosphatase family metal-dependent hydrolase